MRALHAIHDFLPRHRAGSEIYCLALCRALAAAGTATHVLCADYAPARPHGELDWYAVDGVGVTAVVNNWAFASFAESWASPALDRRLAEVLAAIQPDVLHVHNLLNLSFSLPRLARERGIPTVATLHDFTLVCPSGGQRVHVAEAHVCTTIDTARCARCFAEHPFAAQLAFGRRALLGPGGRRVGALAARLRRAAPRLAAPLAKAVRPGAGAVTAADVEERLAAARRLFDEVDLFVAPSQALADEYLRLGVPAARLRVADYGFPPLARLRDRRPEPGQPTRFGFVGTLVWHKGAHLLVAAAAELARDRPGGWEVVLHGDPATFPDYSARLRRDAAGLPVRFAGPFDRAAAATVYAGIDALVVPSLWPENSPLVIHEAFQAGAPVVGSRLGGTAELVAEGVSGLLYAAASPGELAAALRRLLDEPELLPRLAAGVPAVKPLEQDAAEWRAAYEEVLAGWRPRAAGLA